MKRRLQIMLDEESYQKVAAEAERRDTSIAAVIRAAIESVFGRIGPAPSEEPQEGGPVSAGQRRAAIAAIFAAEPMPMPSDPAALRRELDAAHDRVRL